MMCSLSASWCSLDFRLWRFLSQSLSSRCLNALAQFWWDLRLWTTDFKYCWAALLGVRNLRDILWVVKPRIGSTTAAVAMSS